MFIQTEATPNPVTMKFLPGRSVLSVGTVDFRNAAEAARYSPLAALLFGIEGVTGVFLGADFITVSKEEGFEWEGLKPSILCVIMEFFLSGEPVMYDLGGSACAPDGGEEDFCEEDEEIVRSIKELLETHVRPAVARDGGDIQFRGYRDGIVFLHMRGACAGCPSSAVTLKSGVENLFRYFLPEVRGVCSV